MRKDSLEEEECHLAPRGEEQQTAYLLISERISLHSHDQGSQFVTHPLSYVGPQRLTQGKSDQEELGLCVSQELSSSSYCKQACIPPE